MPTKDMYKKYEGNQPKDKVVDSSAGGLFKGEHWSQEYSKTLDWPHPSQAEINEMSEHKHALTCYDKMPEHIKDKPYITSFTPNVDYIEAVGATQRPGDRKLGAQDD